MTARRESDLSITSVIADRIGRHEFLLPIKNNRFNFRKKRLTLRTNISGRDNVRSKKIYLFWKFLSFSRVVAMIIVINSAIGGFG